MDKNLKIEHLLKGITYLDNINLEEKLHTNKLIAKNLTSLTLFDKKDEKNVYFDLSQVQFAELSAITQLVLIIESYVKNDYQVFLSIPTNRYTVKEKESTDFDEVIKASTLRNRKGANSFLKTVGFVEVVRCPHLKDKKEVFITEDYDFEKDFDIENFSNAFNVVLESVNLEYYNYTYLFPLTWINCQEKFDSFSEIEHKIDSILESPDRGLDPIDVQGLKNVVLSELIKNVREHTSSEYALFTIGLVKTLSLFKDRKNKKNNPIEIDYINWLNSEAIKSQVEIYFGDSDCGLLTKKLEDAFIKNQPDTPNSKLSILKWAFSKWSTSKTEDEIRGTKGLYRIQRIVNKYNGIFHIRTDKIDGGYRKGGLKRDEWTSNKLQFEMPGTFIQIKMCPFSESKKFRFTLKENKDRRPWRSIKYNPANEIDFIAKFNKEIIHDENLLVILDLNDLINHDAQTLLENNLAEFSFDAHPNAVVIYVLSKLGNTTLDIIVNSVNNKLFELIGNNLIQELAHKDAEYVYDPVLVIGNNNEAFWYGGNKKIIDLLNESYEDLNKNKTIDNLESFKKLDSDSQTRIRLHLENDNSLVIVDAQNNFLFNFTSIDDFFLNEIRYNYLRTSPSEEKVCTPRLEVVEKWLGIDQLLNNNKYGFALTLYLKVRAYFSSKIGESFNEESLKNDLHILIDHNQQKELAYAFATLLGLKTRNIVNIANDLNTQIPRRTKLFSENDKVIILTTVISSSETIRRLVKYAKRDLASPVIICSLCNFRRYNITHLETWNDATEIISIFQTNTEESARFIRDDDYFKKKLQILRETIIFRSPKFSIEPKLSQIEISNGIKLEKDLREHIIKTKSLHYNHVGIYRDRHFSFYINKERILREESIIWAKIRASIKNWIDLVQNSTSYSKSYTIYYPGSLVFNQSNNNKFLDFLKSLSPQVKLVDDINLINDSNVVYLDFGTITGSSINRIISHCQQVDNLLICIIFNQSKNDDFEVYNRIRTLKNQVSTLGEKTTNFKIDYLYKLSLSFFTSESCPICEHISALDKYKIDQSYLSSFSDDRTNRLKIIEAEEVQKSNYPFDFYYTMENSNNEFSSEVIMKMYEFKLLLEKSENNTQYRIACFKHIWGGIYSNINNEIENCESSLYALIFYLAHEINWLQKEPLIFLET